MKINIEIKEVLKENKINKDDGLTFLLAVYFNLKPSFFNNGLAQSILAAGILVIDKHSTIQWNVPLFEGQNTAFEWVTDWMESFKSINKDRKGAKATCINRMKKFFAENPDVRKDEIISATNMYFRSVDNPKYLKTSHKFIMEGVGLTKHSELGVWIDKLRENETAAVTRTGLRNTMS